MCQNLPYFSWPAVPKTLTTDSGVNGLIYLIGLIVVVLFILSFLGLR